MPRLNKLTNNVTKGFGLYSRFLKLGLYLITFAIGYFAAKLYVLEPFKLLIAKTDKIQGFDKIFSTQDLIAGKLTSLFAIFFSLLLLLCIIFGRIRLKLNLLTRF